MKLFGSTCGRQMGNTEVLMKEALRSYGHTTKLVMSTALGSYERQIIIGK
jgi:hypothetical protein